MYVCPVYIVFTRETGPAIDLPSSACGTRILQHERFVFYTEAAFLPSFALHDPETRRGTTPTPLPRCPFLRDTIRWHNTFRRRLASNRPPYSCNSSDAVGLDVYRRCIGSPRCTKCGPSLKYGSPNQKTNRETTCERSKPMPQGKHEAKTPTLTSATKRRPSGRKPAPSRLTMLSWWSSFSRSISTYNREQTTTHKSSSKDNINYRIDTI